MFGICCLLKNMRSMLPLHYKLPANYHKRYC